MGRFRLRDNGVFGLSFRSSSKRHHYLFPARALTIRYAELPLRELEKGSTGAFTLLLQEQRKKVTGVGTEGIRMVTAPVLCPGRGKVLA